jgi:hypothetical protein
MPDEPENLTLRYLRSIDTRLDGVAHDVHELKVTQAAIMEALATSQKFLAAQAAHMLRVDEKLDRIEKRLNLVDPASGDALKQP